MGRIVVNKHFDDKSKITSESFVNKGEIIVSNQVGYEGIFIVNKNGEIFFIGPTNGTGTDVPLEYKEYIESYVNGKLEDYATEEWVIEQLSGNTIDLSNYITKGEISAYTVTKDEIRQISAEEVAKIVNSADTSYDTLKEIADWIINDTTGSAQMANDIESLKAVSADTRISTIENKLTGLTSSEIYDSENGKTQAEINNFLLQGSEESSKHFFMSTTQYAELVKNGSVIIDGKEFIYDENAYYALYESDEE
jgi:hypothetical protein